MPAVSITCVAPASPATAALKALIQTLDLTCKVTTEGSTPCVTVTTTHALTGLKSSTSSTSWVGCARLLCSQVPSANLWGATSQETALVEAWMETASTTLIPILLNTDKKDDLFAASVTEFSVKMEGWLFGKDQTFLVGDTPTAADVCLGLWLAAACEASNVTTLSQQCFRWVMTVISHPVLKEFAAFSDGKFKLKEGVMSPVAKPAPKGAAAPKAAAATEPKAAAVAPKAEAPKAVAAAAPAAVAPSGDLADNAIVKKLTEFQIEHSVYSHELCMTADELIAKVPLASPTTETHTKNLFLRDKKHGLFLVTVLPTAQVNTKELGQMLNLQGKTNLRMADPKILEECLGCQPGTVGPLAIVNDAGGDDAKVTIVLDQGLLAMDKIHSHPLRNDASVVLTPKALQDYIAKTKHEVVMLDFATAAAGGAEQKKIPAPPTEKQKPQQPKKAAGAPAAKNKDKKTVKKGETLLALQWKKEENFSMWYSDAITLSEMISYYDISGCYILRPWSYKIWELIQEWFNKELRALEVENCYFPLFVTQERLEKEKDHVAGFAPEVAWVTRSGSGELAKPIAVRPTSETIMYPAFSDWIKSHRDLPLKLNQWSNVVRWEFKYPTPFLRSREFLWQEGHTAHASHADADVMVRQALELYRKVYEELLAVPVIPGYKTEEEKFAGGLQTTTVEAYVPVAGRAIQGATSHNLGQNFGKMFDIKYQDKDGKAAIAWQTSWGLTTRTIGVMVMVHGDDTGLVLPPRIAPLQCVIVPITSKKLSMEDVSEYCSSILKDLVDAGIRAKFDDRTMYNPGWKYNHWEQKGVPIRIEVGPRDFETKQARIVVRYSGEKVDMPVAGLGPALSTKLEEIQEGLFNKALAYRDDHLVKVTDWKDFVPELEKHNLVLTPWCGGEHQDWEEWVKNKSREESLASRGEEEEDARTATSVAAKTLCIPFKQPELPAGTKCIASGMDATCWVLWGRSY